MKAPSGVLMAKAGWARAGRGSRGWPGFRLCWIFMGGRLPLGDNLKGQPALRRGLGGLGTLGFSVQPHGKGHISRVRDGRHLRETKLPRP